MMNIRNFKESDADEVSKMLTEQAPSVFSKYYPKEAVDLFVRNSRPEELIKSSKEKEIFVAVDDDQIIGTGRLEGDTISTIFVDISYQGKGVGKAIMDYLEKRVRQKGATKVHLADVAINAVGFYEKLGYQETCSHLYNDIPNTKSLHMVKELR